MSHPRLLFVTPVAFNQASGGGFTFTNLFRGWPKERIATVHSDPLPPATDICELYYELGAAEIGAPPSRSAGLLQRVGATLRGAGLQGELTPRLEAWIEAFRPQLLYTILGGIGMMELIDKIRRRFALPLVVHFMDDWPSAVYRGGPLAALRRRRMHDLLSRLVGAASLRLGICEAMCEAYERRYGGLFTPFQNAIEVARWSALAKADPTPRTPLRLLYTGSVLSFAQEESLGDCCVAVASLARQSMAIQLEIQSPMAQSATLRRRFAGEAAIHFAETIAEDEAYFRTLAAADILLLPVNFDDASQRYIRLSMPTKVPPYLVSGTPILAYGPPGIAQIDYARTAGWAHIVERRDAASLAQAIRHLAEDLPLRRRLAQAAHAAATRHDAVTVRAQFQAALCTAVPEAVVG